ncbi:MAG: Crp/Fnr family transcriptional regulator [Burkholderiales bacterium]
MPYPTCKIEAIRALPLLSLFSDEQLAYILPTVRRRSYPARTFVLGAGDVAEGLYFLLSGSVHLMYEDGDAREVIIAALGPSDFFGEEGLFDIAPRPQSALAQQACDVLFVPRAVLLQCLQRNSAAAVFMMKRLAERLAAAQEKIARFALVDVYGRVASVLAENVHVTHEESVVDLGSTMIAAMVGASREMVSRVLRDMVKKGLIRRQKRKIFLLDRDAFLERSAHPSRRPAALDKPRSLSSRDIGFGVVHQLTSF